MTVKLTDFITPWCCTLQCQKFISQDISTTVTQSVKLQFVVMKLVI